MNLNDSSCDYNKNNSTLASDNNSALASDNNLALVSNNNSALVSDNNSELGSDNNLGLVSDNNSELGSGSDNNSGLTLDNNSALVSDNNSELSSDNSSSYVSSSSDDNNTQLDNLDLLGKSLRHFNIINELGRGAYSIVWLVFNTINKKFYALKVQNPNEFKSGLKEIKFVERLPKKPEIFNNLITYFIEKEQDNKYLCSIWNLYCCNLDNLIRDGIYSQGMPLSMINNIIKQMLTAINILHNKFKVIHGDIKTDNILVKGINYKNKITCEKYEII